MISQKNPRQYPSWRRLKIFSQINRNSYSFFSYLLSLDKKTGSTKKVLRMEPRQLKLKTRNPVGQKYYQQLEGTSSRNFQLSVLSLHRISNKVFGMSNYRNQESVAKHEQQLIDYTAFHFSSTLSTEVFYEGSRHLDRNSEKHSIAIIRANTDNISRSRFRKWNTSEWISRLGGNVGVWNVS